MHDAVREIIRLDHHTIKARRDMIHMAWKPEFAAKLVDQSFGPTPRDAGSQFTITVTAYRSGIRMVNGTVVWREHPELGVQEAIAVLLTEFEKRLDREAKVGKEKP